MNGQWPIDRCGEAIDAIARASRWLGAPKRESPRYDGRPADRWIPACAAHQHIEAEAVLVKYGALRDSLRNLGPSLILLDDELLAVIRTTGRDAVVIAPDGARMRVPLRALHEVAPHPPGIGKMKALE